MAKDLPVETIDDVEVMRVGVWQSANAGRVPITLDDLEGMVKAFEATGSDAPVPLKIGHEMKQQVFGDLADDVSDGEPAFGWVDRLRVEGETLVARLTDVPARLAAFLRAKSWRTRSAEVQFDGVVSGKRWPRRLTAVALLGALPPAVKGMADLFSDGGETMTITLAEMDEADFDEIISQLDSLRERWESAISGRRGAPQTRHLFEAFKADLRRAARLVATMAEGDDMKQIHMALGLTDDATPGDVVALLAEGKAEHVAALVKLADGIAFANAAEFVAWLAGKLNIAPSDLSAIADAVQSALGLETAPPDSTEEPVAPAAAPPAMSGASMSDGEAKLAAEVVTLKGRLARVDAEAAVDELVRAGRAVPAQRDALVKLRLGNAAAFAEFTATMPVVVHMGETGTSAGQDAEVLTPDEIKAARDMGYSLDDVRAYKRSLA